MIRAILVLGILGLAISAPILFSKSDPNNSNSGELGNQASAQQLKSQYLPFEQYDPADVTTLDSSTATVVPHAPVYQAVFDFRELFRFDLNPDWIKSRWSRVSNFQTDDNLSAMRVALVTGPRPVDVHGSLTYCFDEKKQLQRIIFKGWTGDPSEIVNLVTQHFRFSEQKSSSAGFYTEKHWGKLKGALRLDRPPVAQQDLPTQQLMVLLEIVNPQGKMAVSAQTSRILEAMN